MDIDLVQNILYASVRNGTPLLLVALGEMVCEKSGVLNLGQEGMMLIGAVIGFMVAVSTGSLGLGILAAICAGALSAALFGFLTLTLLTNQVATGLALTIFGTGLSAFMGTGYIGKTLVGLQPVNIPYLMDIPVIGKAVFAQDLLVYLSVVIFLLIIWLFSRSRYGLVIRAVGENPEAAHAVGLPVLKTRYLAVLFGGGMAGLAGAYLSIAYTPLWSEGMTSGKGWIALALVVFASWKAERIILGAYLFGFASILHLIMQGSGYDLSPNILSMLPYVATIAVLIIMSRKQTMTRWLAPKSLGESYRPQS